MNGSTVTLRKVGKQVCFSIQYTLYVDDFILILHIDSIDANNPIWLQVQDLIKKIRPACNHFYERASNSAKNEIIYLKTKNYDGLY